MRILSALVGLTAVAWACDYTAFENPNDFAYRYCAVACNKMALTDSNYEPCCRMLSKGAETAAVCTQLASSALAAGSTCSQTQVATTDSTSYSKPTSYSTAPNPTAPVEPTAIPTTGGIEGQSINSPAVVTEWTTTTVAAPCEPTTPPVVSATNTCECSDETASQPAETGGIEGQSYSSETPATPSSNDNWAGNTAPAGYGGLDKRTGKQYTCACWTPPSSSAPPEVSDIEGVPYSSVPSSPPITSAPSSTAEPTSSECTTNTTSNNNWAGNTPTGEIVDNVKRFLPTIYGPGPQARADPTAPVRRNTNEVRTGNEPSEVPEAPVGGASGAPVDPAQTPAAETPAEAAASTITSTATVTGAPTCGGADTGVQGSATDSSNWAGNTAPGGIAASDAYRKRFRRNLR